MPECPNHLIVEDHDQKGAIIHLMKHYIPWSEDATSRTVDIEVANNVSSVLDKAFLFTKFKQSGLKKAWA